jgi:hypothetical protein
MANVAHNQSSEPLQGDKLASKANEAISSVKDMGDQATGKIGQILGGDRLQKISGTVKDGVNKVSDYLSSGQGVETIKRYPFQSLLAGFGAGLLFGYFAKGLFGFGRSVVDESISSVAV